MNYKQQKKETLFKKTQRVSSCRRGADRQKLQHSKVVCWDNDNTPTTVTTIELDSRGARIVLPWYALSSDSVQVSIADQLGHHRTITARIAWAQDLPNTPNTICGLSFEEEVKLAA